MRIVSRQYKVRFLVLQKFRRFFMEFILCVYCKGNRFLVHKSVPKAKLYQRVLRCCVYMTLATFLHFWTYLILNLKFIRKCAML